MNTLMLKTMKLVRWDPNKKTSGWQFIFISTGLNPLFHHPVPLLILNYHNEESNSAEPKEWKCHTNPIVFFWRVVLIIGKNGLATVIFGGNGPWHCSVERKGEKGDKGMEKKHAIRKEQVYTTNAYAIRRGDIYSDRHRKLKQTSKPKTKHNKSVHLNKLNE